MYIFRYTPATFGSLFVIYPSGLWPSGNITNKFLTAGVYLTYPPLGHGLYITYTNHEMTSHPDTIHFYLRTTKSIHIIALQ